MKSFRYLIIVSIISAVWLTGCATFKVHNRDDVRKIIDRDARWISFDSNRIPQLKKRFTSESGYYYLLDNNGYLVWHPTGALIGQSFGRYDFVREVLEKRNGEISQPMGEVTKILFFREVNDNYILCLTIDARELGE